MKNAISRRFFLEQTTVVSTGIILLSSTSSLNAFIKDAGSFNGNNLYAETITDIRNSGFGAEYLTVKGKVFDRTGSYAIPNASIEVWHLSPNSSKIGHMAKLKTNRLGEYEFVTDFPNSEYGKMPRIFFKITTKGQPYFTELLITKTGAYITGKHWEENRQLNDKLYPKKESFLNHSTITFNISK